MKQQPMNFQRRLPVRTHLRAGDQCRLWDTNCVSLYPDGTPSGHFNSCNSGDIGAGAQCEAFVAADTGGAYGIQCHKC
jgi:hypothetical protein